MIESKDGVGPPKWDILELAYHAMCATVTSDINEHLPLLRWLSERSQVVVEMGVRAGVSTIALMAGRPARLVSYDITWHDGLGIHMDIAAQVGAKWEFRKESSLTCEIPNCDLLFIDTLHTYAQLSRELERHHQQVVQWIAMHDLASFGERGEDGTEPGLRQAVTEFLVVHPEWKIVEDRKNNNGLMVLERKP